MNSNNKYRILVVDDEDVIRSLIKEILEIDGYEVLLAETGAEMFTVLASEKVDLVLLDLGLPDGDALPHIIQFRAEGSIPVIVLTARQKMDDRLMALGLGADDYMTKPIHPKELALRVGKLLARSNGEAKPRSRPPEGIELPVMPPPAEPSVLRRSGLRLGFGVILLAIGVSVGGYWLTINVGQEQTQFVDVAQPIEETPPQEPVVAVVVPEPAPVEETPTQEPVKTVIEPEPNTLTAGLPDTTPPSPTVEPSVAEVAQSVTELVDPDQTQPVQPVSTTKAPEKKANTRAERLGYGWIYESKCAEIPDVDWWIFKTHETMANYVVRRNSGDWKAFVDKLVVRLAKLYDISDRNSSIVTSTGVTLSSDALVAYIEKFSQRLDVARCLMAESRIAASQE